MSPVILTLIILAVIVVGVVGIGYGYKLLDPVHKFEEKARELANEWKVFCGSLPALAAL